MKHLTSTYALCLSILLLVITPVYSQHETTESAELPTTAPVQAKDLDQAISIMKKMDAAKPGSDSKPAFDVNDLATITGRIVGDVDRTVAVTVVAPSETLEVKVILQSADPSYGHFVREAISDENGSFSFEYLAPGTYTLRIDPASLPAKYRPVAPGPQKIEVGSAGNVECDLQIAAQRTVSGVVFIDKDGDAVFDARKDQPVTGAIVRSQRQIAISDAAGAYELRELPGGRVGLVVESPTHDKNTHIVLELGPGPVSNRVVNVPMNR
jgi:hypothetical protein